MRMGNRSDRMQPALVAAVRAAGRRLAPLCAGLLLLTAGGCGRAADEEPSQPAMVNLAIGVSVTDGMPQGRAGYEDAATDDEKMQTLRVVVVRPDRTIEHNRLLLCAPTVRLDGTTDAEGTTFKVIGGERKRIYLFVNEQTRLHSADGTRPKAVDYDFAGLVPGTLFPREELEACTIALESATQQLEGPLPMSACHELWMPEEDRACTLTVLRAAVKFSFLLTNRCSAARTLTGLTLDRMADRSWYLPRAEYDADGRPTRFEVPAASGYYAFRLGDDLSVALPAGKTTALAPIYLLEGRYEDPDDARNYAMSVALDGASRAAYFEDLKSLPRNTHVVVRITFTDRETTWEAEVLPYGAVVLDPIFGLD